jgi:hypothetical protein
MYDLTFVIEPIDDAAIDRLAAEGIDWSQMGRLQFAHVDETGESLMGSVQSAVNCLWSLGVRPTRLRLDLVSSSEIASRTGVSRPAVTKWTRQIEGDPPFPVEFDWSTTGPVWVWADVNGWLQQTERAGNDEGYSPSLAEVEQADRWIADHAGQFATA